MVKYFSRLNTPKKSNKYYNDYSYNPFATAAYCMPNCTCYAYGRFSEILGKQCSLPTGNAGTWWLNVTSYKRSQQPQVGAVMCWSCPGRAGHVGIVEEVSMNSNGSVKSVVCSQSSYGRNHDGRYFWTQTLTPPSYNNYVGSSYTFQGFILNPAVSDGTCKPLSDGTGVSTSPIYDVPTTTGQSSINSTSIGAGDAFLHIAKQKADDPGTHAWVQAMIPEIGNQAWCAAFVSACAKASKVAGKAVGISNCCSGIRDATIALGGKRLSGPKRGNYSLIPNPGDLALFTWYETGYEYDHVGIVVEYSTNPLKLRTVEGNTSGGCHYREYTMNGGSVYSNIRSVVDYVRPNWTAVGGITVDVGSSSLMDPYGFTLAMYDSTNTKQDSIIREVGYINSKYEPSINSSDIKLSLMNHTIMYSGLMLALSSGNSVVPALQQSIANSSPTYASSVTFEGDQLAPVPRAIYQYLIQKGAKVSITCAILANIKVASGYQTGATGDFKNMRYNSIGLFQWRSARDKLIEKVPDWKTNLSGQLDFFWEQVTTWTEYRPIYKMLISDSTSKEMAVQYAGYFSQMFEPPDNKSAKYNEVLQEVRKIYDTLTPLLTRPSISTPNYVEVM